MQAIHRFELRLFFAGTLWLLAGALAYLLSRQPGALWFLPPAVGTRLAPVPLQEISSTFPMFAAIIALSLLCVWWFSCGKSGAAYICAGWTMLEVGYQVGQRHDLASWIIPQLPYFFQTVWPLSLIARMLGSGDFNANAVAGAILGGIFAYMMVLNSIPGRSWSSEQAYAR
jgi:hypothetical protein